MKQLLAEEIGELGSGEKVYERPGSHVGSRQDTQLEKFLPLALKKMISNKKEFVVDTIDFVAKIGEANCVQTNPSDEIVFAQREGRSGLSRFVMNKEKIPTSLVTIVLKKTRQGYELVTAYFGPKAPPEPWESNAEADSESFWNNHALIWEEKLYT